MSIWRQLSRGLRALTKRRDADQDIADEVESYLEQAAEELEANGMSSDEARRTVRLHLGNATIVREQVRSYGWENVVSACVSDCDTPLVACDTIPVSRPYACSRWLSASGRTARSLA